MKKQYFFSLYYSLGIVALLVATVFACKEDKPEVEAKLVASFSISPDNPAVGQAVTFTNQSQNADSYSWSSSPAVFNSNEANPSFTFVNAGTYEITLVAKKGQKSSIFKQSIVVVNVEPTVEFSFSPAAPKTGETVTFTVQSQYASSFEWISEPSGFTSTEQNPSFTFVQQGSYQITLKATGPGGTRSITKTITVIEANPAPVADFGFSPATPVIGQSVTFTSQVQNATSFEWSSEPAGLTSTEANPTFTFTQYGEYQVTLKVTGPGGTNTIVHTVNVVFPAPEISFTISPENPVTGQTISFKAQSQHATYYEWSSEPNVFWSTEQNPTFVFAQAETIKITLKATGPGGSTEVSKTVVIGQGEAIANFIYWPTTPRPGETVQFSPLVEGSAFEWSSESVSFSSTEKEPAFVFENEGTFIIQLKINTASGVKTITKEITVSN